MNSIAPSRSQSVTVLLSLLEAQLGEHGYAIGVRDIALHMLPCDHVFKCSKQRDQADIAIDHFLKPPQFCLAFQRASSHGNGLMAQSLCLSIAIAPAVPEAVREPVPVDEIARIRGPGPQVIDR